MRRMCSNIGLSYVIVLNNVGLLIDFPVQNLHNDDSMPLSAATFTIVICYTVVHTGLSKARLSSIQSVLNSAAWLIVRLLRFSHISPYMKDQLHWLPFVSRNQYKI